MMKYKITSYKTLFGKKEIVEITAKKSGQWVIYQNKKPAYFVDCFDFKTASNLMLNNLILSEGKTIFEVLKKIKKTKKIELSVPQKPIFKLEEISKEIRLDLPALPEEWLA